MSDGLWISVVIAGVVAVLAPFVARPVLTRLGTLDVPNGRSSHETPTLRGGGVATLMGFIVGGLCATLSLHGNSMLVFTIVLVAAVATALVGMAEDLRGLSIRVRAGLQLVIGAGAALALGSSLDRSWIWIPVVTLAFAAHVNFTNFMDGINGISGLHGLVVGSAFAVSGVLHSLPWLVAIGAIIAVAFVAFMPWNCVAPGIFLGDVGSYLLGGAVAATAIAALGSGVHPLAVLAPLSIYWADAIAALLRRARRGEPVFHAHRTHAYQRLTNNGLTHLAAAVIVALFTLGASIFGLLTEASLIPWPAGAVAIVVFVATYLFLPRLLGDVVPEPMALNVDPISLSASVPARSQWEPKTWAVLGASGFVGSAVVQRLEFEGIRIVPLSAPRLALDYRGGAGDVIAGLAEQLRETGDLAADLKGVDVVVNAAGVAAPDGSADSTLYGANALLPALVAIAAARAGVARVIHLSSAAVQGARQTLDASTEVAPFSPYSHSKALGERALLTLTGSRSNDTDLVVIRATSVQGAGRPTTESLRRIARSCLASVAAPGDQPTVVSSSAGLSAFVHRVGASSLAMPPILLQPWEGLSVREVLELAGGRKPVVLPRWLCRGVVVIGRGLGRIDPRVAGITRRIELMWFGQMQQEPTVSFEDAPGSPPIGEILKGTDVTV